MMCIMKKLVILFPEVEFLTCSDPKIIDKYINCIISRYTMKGFYPFVVNYKDSKGFYTLLNKINIDSEFSQLCGKEMYPNFSKIVSQLDVKKDDKVVVCGFHCFDCVYKLANEIYKVNKNIIIDSDLTELFPYEYKQKIFDVEYFNPNNKIKTFKACCCNDMSDITNETKKRLYKLYSNPVWGISKKYLKMLKPKTDNENI